MAFTAPATTSVRKARQMTQEKIYDALQGARTADKVTVHFKNGRAATGALIFNPFKGSGRVIVSLRREEGGNLASLLHNKNRLWIKWNNGRARLSDYHKAMKVARR